MMFAYILNIAIQLDTSIMLYARYAAQEKLYSLSKLPDSRAKLPDSRVSSSYGFCLTVTVIKQGEFIIPRWICFSLKLHDKVSQK